MATVRISMMQPVGSAAEELRAIIAGLDQITAVSILRHTEDGLVRWPDDKHIVSAPRGEIYWEVTEK